MGEDGSHLVIAGLVTPDAGNGPEFLEEPGAVGVDGQSELAGQWTEPTNASRAVLAIAVPLDLPITSRDHWPALDVEPDEESVWLGKLPELGERLGLRGMHRYRLWHLKNRDTDGLDTGRGYRSCPGVPRTDDCTLDARTAVLPTRWN